MRLRDEELGVESLTVSTYGHFIRFIALLTLISPWFFAAWSERYLGPHLVVQCLSVTLISLGSLYLFFAKRKNLEFFKFSVKLRFAMSFLLLCLFLVTAEDSLLLLGFSIIELLGASVTLTALLRGPGYRRRFKLQEPRVLNFQDARREPPRSQHQ